MESFSCYMWGCEQLRQECSTVNGNEYAHDYFWIFDGAKAVKVTLAMVSSLDGRTTRGSEPGTGWASAEDQTFFRELVGVSDAVIMGSSTYETVRSFIRPSLEKPRIVMTRMPERFENEPREGIEFTADEPSTVIGRLAGRGLQNVLLAGGAVANARFLDSGLVDEMYVTVEPTVFGEGLPFSAPLQKAVSLVLLKCEQLNDQGTLLLRYHVEQ